LEVIKISKIEKNSKSQDMKIYSATKFSIIVPPKLSEKTKESKLLVRSFRHIYKVAGLGIATDISGLFSLSMLQQDKQISVDDNVTSELSLSEESVKVFERDVSIVSDESEGSYMASFPTIESQDFADSNLDIITTISDVASETLVISDLFIPFIIITGILAGLTVY